MDREYYATGKISVKITKKERKAAVEKILPENLDIENHYAELRRDSGLGDFRRQFALYFDQKGDPILAISSKNPFHSGMPLPFTEINFICGQNSKWQDCTDRLMPKIQLSDFLKPGQSLSSNVRSFFFMHYLLPRKGTTITVHLRYDSYDYTDGYHEEIQKGIDPISKEEKKIASDKIYLKWDKENLRFIR